MGQRIAIFLATLVCWTASAGLTNVNFEPFAEIGTLTSTNVGKLGIISGTFYERAVGPSTNGGAGWSANLRGGNNYHSTSVASGAQTCGMAGAWFYFDSYTIVPAHTAILVGLCKLTFNNIYAAIRLDQNGAINLYASSATQTGVWTPPLRTWIWFAQSWTNSGAGAYTVNSYAMTNGGSLFQLGTNAIGSSVTATLFAIGGSWDTGGTSSFIGRYGMPSIYAMANLTDAAYPSDIVRPQSPPYTWYVSPSTGSDSNTGLSGSPWLTVDKFNTESLNGGIMPSSTLLPGGGDTVIFDNTIPLTISSNTLNLGTSGMRCLFTNGPVVAYATLASTNWTKTVGQTNTWETTDNSSADLTGVVLWEDDKWMTHPTGANYAAVKNTMDTNAGSFFSDGTKVYVHPFGNTDPTSDGKVYTRSRNRNTPNGDAAVQTISSNIWVDGLQVSKTTLCRSTDGDPYSAYCFQWGLVNSGGTNILSNFYVSYFSKHGVGNTTGNLTNSCCIRTNGLYGPGSPYAGFGGQTADVDYALGGSGNTFQYYNCTNLTNSGVIGGIGGTSSGAQFWVSHGSGKPFNGGLFNNVYTVADFLDQGVNAGTIYFTNSTFAFAGFSSDFDIQNCQTTAGVPTQLATNHTGRIINSILTPIYLHTGPAYSAQLAGTQAVVNCTIQWTPASYVPANAAVWSKADKTTFFFTNNILTMPATGDFVLLNLFTTNDVLALGNNVYQSGITNIICTTYNDGTTTTNRNFTQWRALGFDAGSVNQNACLDSRLRPYSKTPCWNVGAELGPLIDYSGKLFQSRRTAGAYEYMTPAPWRLTR